MNRVQTVNARPLFRFDAQAHEYVELASGLVLPHITGMLEQCGYSDPRYYTIESRERGHAVHSMTAALDLGGIEASDVPLTRSAYKGYLQAYQRCRDVVGFEIEKVEEPMVHSRFRFGGRPDRVIRLDGRRGVLEIKSGQREKGHAIQTWLQAMLESDECGIPPEHLARWVVYLKNSGKFEWDEFDKPGDRYKAMEVVAECCG